jgi:hypothetical protein
MKEVDDKIGASQRRDAMHSVSTSPAISSFSTGR